MIPNTSENQIQKNCIELFKNMGYEFIDEEQNILLRDNKKSNVIFENILKEQLRKINNYEYKGKSYKFSDANINKAVKDLDVSLNKGLMISNEEITNYLLLGTSYEETLNDGTKKSFSFKYIDFENIQNNHFSFTEEFRVDRINQNEELKTRRPDMVLFINGIPIVVIELKKSSKNYENGIKQLELEQRNDEIPNLFKFIQLSIAGNTNEAKYGTTGTALKFYSLWKEEEEEYEKDLIKIVKNRNINLLDKTLFSLLKKERLLRLIRHYIVFDKRVKKVCRYQQFFAIEKALKRAENIKDGIRSGGLIWHTQGSGKSLTMVMLTKLLKHTYVNSRIIVVTDRTDLDEQIHQVFKHTDIKAGMASSGKDLIFKLKRGVNVITTLVHKFKKAMDSKLVINDNNIFVLVDESHRTQSGDLHNAMKKTLPFACYIGFTGTPLLKDEKNSFAQFGGEIHRYTIDEAVKDEAILPLFYEGRLVEQKVPDPEGLNRMFDIYSKDLNDDEKKDLQRKWTTLQKVASSEQRLTLIALDIDAHFKKELKNTGFKAILAASSKFDAIRYHKIFNDISDIKTAYVISSSEYEELDGGNKEFIAKAWHDNIREKGSEEAYLKWVKNEFIFGDEVDLLIVVEKLLTGFDAPNAKVLYIDRQLKEHNLLQAIARVNRINEGKSYGLIIDYRGLLKELDEALTSYSVFENFDLSDIKGAVIDIRKEIEKVKEYYTHLEELFNEVRFKNDIENYVKILEDTQKRNDFKEYLSCFARALKLALCSRKIDDVLDEEQIKTYKTKMKFYSELRKIIQLRYHEVCDFGKYEVQMQKLLDTFINVGGINKLTELINIFDSKFDREVMRIEGKSARADTILNAISVVIKEKMDSNPVFYKSIAQQIKDIINEYKAKRLSEEEKLVKAQQLKDIIIAGMKPNNNTYPKEFENQKFSITIYDNLKELLEYMKIENFEDIIKDLTFKVDKIYKETIKKPEWEKSKDTENEIEGAMEDLFWDIEDKYSVNIHNKDEIYKTLRKIGINFYA